MAALNADGRVAFTDGDSDLHYWAVLNGLRPAVWMVVKVI